MTRLTKAEEAIMQMIWRLERCTVSDLLKEIEQAEGQKKPHSSISSIVRILEEKGFVDHKAYGRTYEYFPIVTKSAYSKLSLKKLARDYFGGSMNQLVSFLIQEKQVNVEDLSKLIDQMEEE